MFMFIIFFKCLTANCILKMAKPILTGSDVDLVFTPADTAAMNDWRGYLFHSCT